jgi:4'-phosphopantetheinyl transferase
VPISLFVIALDGGVAAAERLLDAGEIERANRFRFPHLRERYVLSHGVLRVLLGRFSTGELKFVIGEKGKPRLADSTVAFNMSHSGAFAAYAFADGIELGVDIEEMRPLHDLERTARRTFSSGECDDLFTRSGEALIAGFYDLWTRKEAFIKALGLGLWYPLDYPLDSAPDLDGWQFHAFEVADGYAGALAYRGARQTVEITHAGAAAVLDEFCPTGDIEP